jgi:hypothetical protein
VLQSEPKALSVYVYMYSKDDAKVSKGTPTVQY